MLGKWCESVSGGEIDRHVQGGRPLRGNEELSDVSGFSVGPSPHEDCLAEDAFVDDVRGGVLETEKVKQARQEKFQWCRGMGVWEPVLRKDMEPKGAKAVSLRLVDTNKDDAGRPNYRSRLVAREIKMAKKNENLFSGMPLLESVNAFFSLSSTPPESQEETTDKQTLAMYDISRADFHRAPVRRVFVEPPDEEKESLAPEKKHSGIRWLAEKVHVCHSGRQCFLASALRADLENTSSPKVSAIPLCLCT